MMLPYMVKTTVYLDSDTALALRDLARRRGRPQAELIREAVAKFTAEDRPPLPSIGAFKSGRTDVSANYRELIRKAVREDRWP